MAFTCIVKSFIFNYISGNEAKQQYANIILSVIMHLSKLYAQFLSITVAKFILWVCFFIVLFDFDLTMF